MHAWHEKDRKLNVRTVAKRCGTVGVPFLVRFQFCSFKKKEKHPWIQQERISDWNSAVWWHVGVFHRTFVLSAERSVHDTDHSCCPITKDILVITSGDREATRSPSPAQPFSHLQRAFTTSWPVNSAFPNRHEKAGKTIFWVFWPFHVGPYIWGRNQETPIPQTWSIPVVDATMCFSGSWHCIKKNKKKKRKNGIISSKSYYV